MRDFPKRLQPLIEEAKKMHSQLSGTDTYSEGYWHGVKVGLEITLEQHVQVERDKTTESADSGAPVAHGRGALGHKARG